MLELESRKQRIELYESYIAFSFIVRGKRGCSTRRATGPEQHVWIVSKSAAVRHNDSTNFVLKCSWGLPCYMRYDLSHTIRPPRAADFALVREFKFSGRNRVKFAD